MNFDHCANQRDTDPGIETMASSVQSMNGKSTELNGHEDPQIGTCETDQNSMIIETGKHETDQNMVDKINRDLIAAESVKTLITSDEQELKMIDTVHDTEFPKTNANISEDPVIKKVISCIENFEDVENINDREDKNIADEGIAMVDEEEGSAILPLDRINDVNLADKDEENPKENSVDKDEENLKENLMDNDEENLISSTENLENVNDREDKNSAAVDEDGGSAILPPDRINDENSADEMEENPKENSVDKDEENLKENLMDNDEENLISSTENLEDVENINDREDNNIADGGIAVVNEEEGSSILPPDRISDENSVDEENPKQTSVENDEETHKENLMDNNDEETHKENLMDNDEENLIDCDSKEVNVNGHSSEENSGEVENEVQNDEDKEENGTQLENEIVTDGDEDKSVDLNVRAEISSNDTSTKPDISDQDLVMLLGEEDAMMIQNGQRSTLEERTAGVFECPLCLKKFKKPSSRYTHIKNHHKIQVEFGAVQCLEEGCSFSCAYTTSLQRHLSLKHGIKMDYTEHYFKSFDEFEEWKYAYEKQNCCRFVRGSGERSKGDDVKGYLYCNRSGTYKRSGTGKKRMRSIGSAKISAHCTSAIKYHIDLDGRVKVKLCSTHYGHKKDYRYLRMTKQERDNIFEKIKSGVPEDIVLDSVRLSCREEQLDKIHLISRRDIDNIKRSKKTTKVTLKNVSGGRPADTSDHIDKWIEGILQSGEDNPVLYFKKKHYPCVNNVLEYEDECIMLMTAGQSDICSKLANDGILYAPILLLPHLGNFFLTTLLVVDEFNSTFPIAFMICNRRDDIVMELYFSIIFKKQGPIKVQAFVTDNLKYVYDAWCNIMEPTIHHLWANRYVDEEWREYLSVISNEELQISVYDQLYSFIECSDGDCKSDIPQVFENIFRDSNSHMFGEYLKENFLDHVEKWATCYIKDTIKRCDPINYDSSYNKIKETFDSWNVKNIKYLSKSAQELIKLVVDFQLERNSKICNIITEINRTHDMHSVSDTQNVFPVDKTTWKVTIPGASSSAVNLETITLSECVYKHDCVLVCNKCKLCYHSMKCTCEDYKLHSACKHLHLVALVLRTNEQRAVNKILATESVFKTESELTAPKKEIVSSEMCAPKSDKSVRQETENSTLDVSVVSEISVTPGFSKDIPKLVTKKGSLNRSAEFDSSQSLQTSKFKVSVEGKKSTSTPITKSEPKKRGRKSNKKAIKGIISKIDLSKELILKFELKSLIKAHKLADNFYKQLSKIERGNTVNVTPEITATPPTVKKYFTRNKSSTKKRKEIVRMEDSIPTFTKSASSRTKNSGKDEKVIEIPKKTKKTFIGWECDGTDEFFPSLPDDFIVSVVEEKEQISDKTDQKSIDKKYFNTPPNGYDRGKTVPLRTYSKRKLVLDNEEHSDQLMDDSSTNDASLETNKNNKLLIAKSYLSPKRIKNSP